MIARRLILAVLFTALPFMIFFGAANNFLAGPEELETVQVSEILEGFLPVSRYVKLEGGVLLGRNMIYPGGNLGSSGERADAYYLPLVTDGLARDWYENPVGGKRKLRVAEGGQVPIIVFTPSQFEELFLKTSISNPSAYFEPFTAKGISIFRAPGSNVTYFAQRVFGLSVGEDFLVRYGSDPETRLESLGLAVGMGLLVGLILFLIFRPKKNKN